MRWRREVDYHGYRSYGDDDSRVRPFRAIVAWLAKLGARKPPKQAEPGFSLLGARSPAPARRPADCPFPLKADASPYAPDWRVLP